MFRLFSGSQPAEADTAVASVPGPPDPAGSQPPLEASEWRLDRRFPPSGTQLVFSLRMSALAAEPRAQQWIALAGPEWDRSVGRLLRGFNLGFRNLRRLSWASTSLPDWQDQSVVLLQFEDDQDISVLEAIGQPVDLRVAGLPCRRLLGGAWPAPFVILDAKTLLTGRPELLGQLTAESGLDREQTGLGRLLKQGAPEADFWLLLDLAGARAAGWGLPGALLDGWPEGKQAWDALWQTPQALGLWVRKEDHPKHWEAQLAWLGQQEGPAERVRAALDQLIPAMRKSVDCAPEVLVVRLPAAGRESGNPRQYEFAKPEAQAALAAARWEAVAGTVWLRTRWPDGSLPAVQAAKGKSPQTGMAADAKQPASGAKQRPTVPADQAASAPAGPDQEGLEPAPEEDQPLDRSPEGARPSSQADCYVALKVDAQARLADRYPEIRLPGVPMIQAVRLLAGMSTLRITLDLDAMAEVGAGPRDPIRVQLKNATTAEILQAMASQRRLGWVLVDGQVLVTRPQDGAAPLRLEHYDVSDLVGTEAAAGEELAGWVGRLVAPRSWRQAGGQGTLQFANGILTVRQTDRVHSDLQAFWRRLRLARGLWPREWGPADPTLLSTRLDRAWAKLREPVTLNFFAPTPLGQILAELEQSTHTTILVDWLSLAAAGMPGEPKGVLQVHQRPLWEALVELLQPWELSYRIVGPDLFEVTTRRAAAARLELEFYPIRHLLAAGHSGPALVERIRAELAPASWSGSGGAGVAYLDGPSGHLIVLQSQPVQASIQIFLNGLAKGREESAAAAPPEAPKAGAPRPAPSPAP